MALLTLPISEVHVETPRTRAVQLSLAGNTFSFRAGQAIWLGRHGQPLRKPYSIACAPEQARAKDAIELLIQVAADSNAGPHLGVPMPGTIVDVEGPMGEFSFPVDPPGRRFLFVAGGTGIAPLRAMLWHALSAFPERRVALLYSARTPDEFAYAGEMRHLAQQGRIALRETVTRETGARWTGERGRISPTHIAPVVVDPDVLCFVCGPPAMVQDVVGWLRERGVPAERILAEGSA